MDIYCTVCSREKSSDEGLLEAVKRYRGDHISFIQKKSQQDGKEFRILSGKYGLLDFHDEIPFYDYHLLKEDLSHLIEKVTNQIVEQRIEKITFFTKEKWAVYNELMQHACAGIALEVRYLENLVNDHF